FTGLPFRVADGEMTDEKKAEEFRNYISSLDTAGKAAAYRKIMSIPPEESVKEFVTGTLAGMTRADMEAAIAPAVSEQTGMAEEMIAEYITSMSDEELAGLLAKGLEEQFRAQYAAGAEEQMRAMSDEQLAAALDMAIGQFTEEQCVAYYDELAVFSDSTYEDNLVKLGLVDRGSPAAINLYASSFADKDVIEEVIAEYTEGVDDLKEKKYTDYVGLIMSSVTTIITALTYVLIAFSAVSLVVSSIMIGVVTLISVQERTREIGILRAMGASKRNISSLFNAETVIIGFASGMLGVLITYLLCIPINIILRHLTGLGNLAAYLPPEAAVALVVISMLLTLLAGIIPSRSAAKNDPVVALRAE